MKPNFFYSILFLAVLTGCSGGKNKTGLQENQGADSTAQSNPGGEQVVRIIEVHKQMISRSIEYTSNLIPFEENHLVPSTPGRIEKIYVEIGDRISRGDLLVQMDRTQLHQAEIQLQNVENDFKRLDTLNKVGSISKQQYEQMKAQYDIALSNVVFLKENTVLKAPFEGVVSGKYFENGEFYSGAPSTPVGKAAIVSIVQINPVKAVVNISEKYFPLVNKGMTSEVTCDIYPGKKFSGKVMRIHPTIDPATRSFQVEIKISNDKEILRPGMFSRVSMKLGEEMALVIPSVAVLKMQGSNERYIFLEEDGTAKHVTVQIGKRFDDQVEVISDELTVGSHLIVMGQARLVDGDLVNVVTD
jgi:RND family efflux transporter MFP subunit